MLVEAKRKDIGWNSTTVLLPRRILSWVVMVSNPLYENILGITDHPDYSGQMVYRGFVEYDDLPGNDEFSWSAETYVDPPYWK